MSGQLNPSEAHALRQVAQRWGASHGPCGLAHGLGRRVRFCIKTGQIVTQ